MKRYAELWNTNQAQINEYAARGWTVHTYGSAKRRGEGVVSYVLMEREVSEEETRSAKKK